MATLHIASDVWIPSGTTQSSLGHKAGAVILDRVLAPEAFSTTDILNMYWLRWRVELAFKRLKSAIGLKRPLCKDTRTARAFILAHLLMILLFEPLAGALEDSPRWPPTA